MSIDLVDAFNSMTTFGVLVAIAFLLVLLVFKKERQTKPSK